LPSRRAELLLLGTLLLALVLRSHIIAAYALNNLGAIALQREVWLASVERLLQPELASLYDVLPIPGDDREPSPMERAMTLAPDEAAIRWATGRVLLAQGNADAASTAMEPLVGLTARNSLLFQDMLIAFSHSEAPDRAVTLYETSAPTRPNSIISDTVTLAYLAEGGRDALQRALVLRPSDLCANFAMWKESYLSGDTASSVMYSDRLRHFATEAILPTDQLLLDRALTVVPALIEHGIWPTTTLQSTISFWSWRYSDALALDTLLLDLVRRSPDDARWLEYLGELSTGAGRLDEAAALYRDILELEPENDMAMLGLAVATESIARASPGNSRGQLAEAAEWYERYRQAAPEDVLGLDRLATILAEIEHSDAGRYQALLQDSTDARRIAAHLMDLPVNRVTVDANLVANPQFTSWDAGHPVNWWPRYYLGPERDKALFALGLDQGITGQLAVRLSAIWTEPAPSGGVYAEYVGKSFRVGSGKYLVSIHFRAQVRGTNALFLVGDQTQPSGVVLIRTRLPDTGGVWRRLNSIVDGPDGTAAVSPVIRNWGSGDLWVQSVEVRRVYTDQVNGQG